MMEVTSLVGSVMATAVVRSRPHRRIDHQKPIPAGAQRNNL
jgi:hypothetical protein